ncbi:MAG: hypothetical protein M1834_001951 [Cirrosporium novae-zelandiae]|nr:MAG: hypothetical protein M1834_001951 [Cirrosporium novae-zelandiae]
MGTNDEKNQLAVQSNDSRSILSAPAYALPYDRVVRQLSTNVDDGLHNAEAEGRLQKYGTNELEGGSGVQLWKVILEQIFNAMVLVLIVSMIVSFAIQSWIEGGVITTVIALNVIVGSYQEYGAEKTMDSLRSLSSPSATVVRDGKSFVIPSMKLVPGDLIELKMGDTIPADVRLVEAKNFEADEALLTGESLPVAKSADSIFDEDTGPGDRLNMAYSPTTVTKGRALGVVIATGMMTEIGQIAKALQGKESRRRPVKRASNGKAKLHQYVRAYILTVWDMINRFLGTSGGTPLQQKLARLALLLFVVAVVFAIIVEASNRFSNNPEVIIYAVATGLSMIPASLVVVLTITMAVGTRIMVQRNVIVRKLDSLEALGAVTNICSDKTGTITQGMYHSSLGEDFTKSSTGKMVVKRAWIPAHGTYSVGQSSDPLNPDEGSLLFAPEEPSKLKGDWEADTKPQHYSDLLSNNNTLKNFLNVASLANVSKLHQNAGGEWTAQGDPTEIGFMVFASRFDWNQERWVKGENPTWQSIYEFPFDSDIKKMSVVFRNLTKDSESSKEWVFSKGAVERILASCDSIAMHEDEEAIPLTDEIKERILTNMEALAAGGLRVLSLAYKPWTSTSTSTEIPRSEVECDLTFLGLIGLYDPPRPESAGAVASCHTAGINVHMVTGDHPATAQAIAKQVGILPANMHLLAADVSTSLVMTASQFDRLSDDEIDALPSLPLVIARCAPNTKVRMISALHRRRAFSAMTGDGVNDSPSLKAADVSIGMGSGSDVAKSASAIILTDNNFASILNAIEEGRRIFSNIQKFVLHLLTQNIGQACTLLIGLAFKDEVDMSVFPLSPVEILWIIMIASSFPAMGLGMEPAAPDSMTRPPHSLKAGVFTWEVVLDMLVYGAWMAVLCLSSFILVIWGWSNGDLGVNCNDAYSARCDDVFGARATGFVCMTWFSLLLAWEVVHLRRSFFLLHPSPSFRHNLTQWTRDVWANRFLFWAVVAGFITVFPVLYIPVINRKVFKHESIDWEWGIVFIESVLFVMGIETWKWAKRVYFRRRGGDRARDPEEGVAN